MMWKNLIKPGEYNLFIFFIRTYSDSWWGEHSTCSNRRQSETGTSICVHSNGYWRQKEIPLLSTNLSGKYSCHMTNVLSTVLLPFVVHFMEGWDHPRGTSKKMPILLFHWFKKRPSSSDCSNTLTTLNIDHGGIWKYLLPVTGKRHEWVTESKTNV